MRTLKFCRKCGNVEDFCLCKLGIYPLGARPRLDGLDVPLLWRDSEQSDFYASIDAWDEAFRRLSGAEQKNQVDGECAKLRRIWRLNP